MRRETLKGLAQRKAEGFKSHDSRLARKATAFGKKLAGLSNERRFSWKKFN